MKGARLLIVLSCVATLLLVAARTLLHAQSLPAGVPGNQGFYYNYEPGAAGWNRFFQAKQDWVGNLPLTVATLPTCTTTNQYYWAVVTDASAPTYLGALTGGGSTVVPVFCDGAQWTSH